MEIAIVLMVLLITVAVVAIKLSDTSITFPFASKKQLFTEAERQFLHLIETAVGDEFRVMCRIKLIDLLSLKNNTSKKMANSALLQAGKKHVDFVLCDRKDFTPVLAIDLVYGQGKDGHKLKRDYFVSGALDTVAIPHARIKAKAGYTVTEIRECIETKLVPLRRKQGKIPFGTSQDKPELIKRTNKPTRPLSPSRNAIAA
ncbi:DUF2726 domain-containing protein [Glaciecola sp. 1036]|uniref:DUF2726 domain-containing protein n=1 Tax=Alteromonadaceae TaxID=72275 RepID=UPI003D0834F1